MGLPYRVGSRRGGDFWTGSGNGPEWSLCNCAGRSFRVSRCNTHVCTAINVVTVPFLGNCVLSVDVPLPPTTSDPWALVHLSGY